MIFYLKKFCKTFPWAAITILLATLISTDTFFGCLVNDQRWTPVFMITGFMLMIAALFTFVQALASTTGS